VGEGDVRQGMFDKFGSFFSSLVSGKGTSQSAKPAMRFQPYASNEANAVYNSFFMDDIELLRPGGKLEGPWKVIFSKNSTIESLKSLTSDPDTRICLLAYNALRKLGIANPKEVLEVVVEVGATEGLYTLAIYKDLHVKYITETGKILVSETTDNATNEGVQDLLSISQKIIGKAETWNQPRQAPPPDGEFRVTFLASDGTYLGQGKLAEIKDDLVASAMIRQAGETMASIAKKARESEHSATSTPAKAA
jgi:hypothetical protein